MSPEYPWHNTLDEYLHRNKVRADLFAESIKASKAMVSFLRLGKRRPSVELAKRIETATKGKVGALELLGLAPEQKPKRVRK